MKRAMSWFVGLGVSAVFIGLILQNHFQGSAIVEAAKKQAAPPANAAPAATPAQPAAQLGSQAEKIAYTFSDDAKIKDFTNLWQQRQGIILRMTVLQAYWNEEQAALKQVNDKVTADYKLDPSKNYFLDAKRHVLIEREAPPAPPGSAQPQAANPAAAKDDKGLKPIAQ